MTSVRYGPASDTLPRMMVYHNSIPVLVLEVGWSEDSYYGPVRGGNEFACLADLGHVVEPRVIHGQWLKDAAEAEAGLRGLAEKARLRAEAALGSAAQFEKDIQRLRRYALTNGCDW